MRPDPASREGRGRPGRRLWVAGALVLVVIVAAAVLTLVLYQRDHVVTTSAGYSAAAGSPQLAAEATARREAVAFVTGQVGRNIIIACDAVMCSDLARHGFPAGNLNVVQPTAPDPYGSDLVIATAGLRSQFGAKLASTDAPQVIASFGTGVGQIDIRVIAQQGAAAFQAASSADEAARKASGLQLLRNKRLVVAPAARQQLAAGQVDSRLLTTIAFLTGQTPVSVLGFASIAPGASPGVPLRFAYLAPADTASRMTGPAYLKSLIALLRAQGPPYVPMSIAAVRLPTGQAALRIEFAAPSPTGLLKS